NPPPSDNGLALPPGCSPPSACKLLFVPAPPVPPPPANRGGESSGVKLPPEPPDPPSASLGAKLLPPPPPPEPSDRLIPKSKLAPPGPPGNELSAGWSQKSFINPLAGAASSPANIMLDAEPPISEGALGRLRLIALGSSGSQLFNGCGGSP